VADPLLPGKLPPELLRRLLAAGGAPPPELRVGPAVGEDACALDVPAGCLVAATDPVTLTGSGVGAHAVVINANDVAVMGARPRWFLAAVLLPEGTREGDVQALFAVMRDALERCGASLVGGHTEVTGAVRQPVVVGQMLGICERGALVRTGGARPGDVLVQVGPAPVEGAAVLAEALGARAASLSAELRERAGRALEDPGISVVEPALRAAACGATSLHDPTEGGLATGIAEVAAASGAGIRVDASRIAWFEPGLAMCEAAGADPWGTLASGALLAAFPPERAPEALERLAADGAVARVIGWVVAGSGVRLADGAPLPAFARDEVARVLEPGGRRP